MDDPGERIARLRALQRWLLSQDINVGDSAVLALDLVAFAIVQMAPNRTSAIAAAEAVAKDVITDIPRLWDAGV